MKKVLVLVCAMLLMVTMGFSQSDTGKIIGKVVDVNNEALPGVSVTLTGGNTGKMSTVTDKNGGYRFLRMPVGKGYQLTFEMPGFKTHERLGVDIWIGSTSEINVILEQSAIEETISVTAPSPLIDTKSSEMALNVTSEQIYKLPTSRDPYTLMNLAPGMLMDREDVGGNQSGQASQWSGFGSAVTDTTWKVDGATVTDPQAIGAPPGYVDVNSYEEVQISYAANDVTFQSGGVQLNFVSKRGGNKYSGTFRMFLEDEPWQLDNFSKHDAADLAPSYVVSPGIFRMAQYGLDFGGPIIKDKLFFYGSYNIHDIHARNSNESEDATLLKSGYSKMSWQLGNNMGSLYYSNNQKSKRGRAIFGIGSQEDSVLVDQESPSNIFVISDQHAFGNLLLHARISWNSNDMELLPRGAELQGDRLVGNDILYTFSPTFYVKGTFGYFGTLASQKSYSFDGTYYVPDFLGGDHEILFGAEYLKSKTNTNIYNPNGRELNRTTDFGMPFDTMTAYCSSHRAVAYEKYALFASDTAVFGNLTVTFGLRYDVEQGAHLQKTSVGFLIDGINPWPNYLGDLTAPARKIDRSWKVLSPRLSLAYDITGDGKNVVKLSAARYGSVAGTKYIADFLWTLGDRYITVPWYDLNGDGTPQLGEFPATGSLDDAIEYGGFDPRDPYALESSNRFDPNFASPLLDELVVSYEREMAQDLATSLILMYRKSHRGVRDIGIMADGSLETADNWYLAGYAPVVNQPYYDKYEFPVATYRTNYEKSYNRYMSATFVLKKRFSHRWMLDASFTYINWKQVLDQSEYFDLTNFDAYNNGTYGITTWGNPGVYLNSRWQAKLAGLYQLPYEINLSFVLTGRDGYVAPYYYPVQRMKAGQVEVYEGGQKFGDQRLSPCWVLNLGIEKMFQISDRLNLSLHADAFNVTNSATVLGKSLQLLGSTDEITSFLNPTVFQFGARLSF